MVLFTRLFLLFQFICGYHADTITRYVAPASSLLTYTYMYEPAEETTTYWKTYPNAALTITTRPTGVSIISTWSYMYYNARGSDIFEWVKLEATDFPNGELPTPTEELNNSEHIPTFAEVTTYTASPHCATIWTATVTQYIDIDSQDWWVYIPRATSTVRGPVMKTTIYPISPTTAVSGPATYVYTTTTTTINQAPNAATRTPGPMYYLQTGHGFTNLNQYPERYQGQYHYSIGDDYNLVVEAPDFHADYCRHPTNLPPGPNYDWNRTTSEWELPYEHDFAEHRRRKMLKIIIPVVVIATILIVGLFESWFWFGRLMTGRKCFRMGTWTWSVTTLVGFCFLKSQKEWKDTAHREELAGRWKQMGVKQKLGLWLKWGFRRGYPVDVLGNISEDPGRAQALDVVRLVEATRTEQERRTSVDTLPVYVDTAPAYSKTAEHEEVAVQHEEVDVEQGAGLGQGNGQGR